MFRESLDIGTWTPVVKAVPFSRYEFLHIKNVCSYHFRVNRDKKVEYIYLFHPTDNLSLQFLKERLDPSGLNSEETGCRVGIFCGYSPAYVLIA